MRNFFDKRNQFIRVFGNVDLLLSPMQAQCCLCRTVVSLGHFNDILIQNDKLINPIKSIHAKPANSFGSHIVNFPFMSSNIPSAPTYGVYASQLLCYARCCSNYSDFLIRHRALVKRLLSQGYKVNRLSNTFKKFYGRHTDLVGQYKKSVCQMFADSIS